MCVGGGGGTTVVAHYQTTNPDFQGCPSFRFLRPPPPPIYSHKPPTSNFVMRKSDPLYTQVVTQILHNALYIEQISVCEI